MIFDKFKVVKSNKNLNDIMRGGLLAFLMRVMAAITSLFLSMFISRALGAEEAGYYFFLTSLLMFLSSLASFGLQNAILKDVAVHEKDIKFVSTFMTKAISLVIISSFIIYLIAIIVKSIMGTVHYIVDDYFLYVFLILPFFSLMFLFSSYFQARNEIVLSMLMFNFGYQALMFLLLLVFGLESLELLLFIFLISVFFVILSALYVFFVRHKNRIIISDRVTYRYMFTLCIPMMVAQVVSQLNNFSGQFLLSFFASPKDIALFSVSLRIATVMSFMTLAVNRVVAPKYARIYNENNLFELNKLVIFTNRLLFVFSFPMLLFVIFFGEELLGLFGPGFSDAYIVLVLVALGQFIASVTGTVVFLLQMTGYHKQLKNNIIISSVVSITIGLILIPSFGIEGAAIMMFVSLASTNLLSSLSSIKLLGINPIKLI